MRKREMIAFESVTPLPVFWPSISSVKTNAKPIDYMRIVRACKHSNFLISAYDIARMPRSMRREVRETMMEYWASNRAVLVDSGNYEKYWHDDRAWKRKSFSDVLPSLGTSFVTTFDTHTRPTTARAAIDDAISSYKFSAKHLPRELVIPIVHGATQDLPRICAEVVRRLSPTMICVAERELGNGMLQRTTAIRKIRRSLAQGSHYTPIHVLGTGNPLSLALLAAAGADSFDGLEWCQTSVDPQSGTLHHFQHADLLVDDDSRDAHVERFFVSTLSMNLRFYEKHMGRIRHHLDKGTILRWVAKQVRYDACERILQALSGRLA